MIYGDSRELRTALQYAVAQICTEQELNAGNEMSSGAIQALSELAFQYATTLLSNDLQAFSSHANRKLIKVDDVVLIVRKNSAIKQKLRLFLGVTPSSTKREHTNDNFLSATMDGRPSTSTSAVNNSTSFQDKLIWNMDSTQESDKDEGEPFATTINSELQLSESSRSSSDVEFGKENPPKHTQKAIDQIEVLDDSSEDNTPEPFMKRIKTKTQRRKLLTLLEDLSDTDESM